MRARTLATLSALAIILGFSVASTSPASAAAPFRVGAATYNCGIVTCSLYISRSGTKSMDRFLDAKVAQYGSYGAETIVCTAMSAVPYIGAGLAVYCGFRFAQFDQVLDEAADKNKCFKITHVVGGGVTHISTNNGSLCKN